MSDSAGEGGREATRAAAGGAVSARSCGEVLSLLPRDASRGAAGVVGSLLAEGRRAVPDSAGEGAAAAEGVATRLRAR